MSKLVKVLTTELSGNIQISLNEKQYVFTEDMLTRLSSIASIFSEDKIAKLSAIADATTLSAGTLQYDTVEINKNN